MGVVEKVSLARLGAEDPAKLKPWVEKCVGKYSDAQVMLWNVDEIGSFLGFEAKTTRLWPKGLPGSPAV